MAEIGNFFADQLRPRWVNGLNKVAIPKVEGMEAWLLAGEYSWLPSTENALRLDVSVTTKSLADAIASEVARFSCAAYESLFEAVPGEHSDSALGWALVRYYYATFYAAHALLRLYGGSVTMISAKTAAFLSKVAGQYLGVSPQLPSGLYFIHVDPRNTSHLLIKKIGSSGGGSHEEMWKIFLSLLGEIEDELILAHGHVADALAAVQVLANLRKQLCRNGKNGAWLSMVRNGLNYRHEYGVWYPYGLTKKYVSTLSNKMTQWNPTVPYDYEITNREDDLLNFIESCNVTTRLLTSALHDLARRSDKSSFVDRRPFKLLRLRKIMI